MIRTTLLILIMTLCWSFPVAADWSLPVTIQSGAANTSVTLVQQAGATNGFDAGKDVPGRPYEADDLLHASFPHPGWGVVLGGESVYGYTRDARSSLPQEYQLEVISKQSQVTLSWNSANLPSQTNFVLSNPTAGDAVDMSSRSSYNFSPGGTLPITLSIKVSQGELAPPAAPSGVQLDERETSLFISWDRNTEPNLSGYKVHFGTYSSTYSRSIDVHNVTNYSLFNLDQDEVYYIAVSAYDQNGNESTVSSEVVGSYQFDTEPPLIPLGLTASSNQSVINLSWSANGESDLAGYWIYYGTTFGSFDYRTDVGTSTSYTLTSAEPGIEYHFALSAEDVKGNESSLSTVVSAHLVNKIVDDPIVDDSADDDSADDDSTLGNESSNKPNPAPASKQPGGIVRYASGVSTNTPGNSRFDTPEKKIERGTGAEGSEQQPFVGSGDSGGGRPAGKNNPFERSTRGQEPHPVKGETQTVNNKDVADSERTDQSANVFGKKVKHTIQFDASPWKLLTVPLKVSASNPFAEHAALGADLNNLMGWDTETQAYRKLKRVQPGVGFMVKVGKGYANVEGQPIANSAVQLALGKDLNLVGNPFLDPLPVSQIQVRDGEQIYTLTEAVAKKLVASKIRSYEAGKEVSIAIEPKTILQPWQGYWFQAAKACELIIHSGAIPQMAKIAAPQKKVQTAQTKPVPHKSEVEDSRKSANAEPQPQPQ